MCILHERVIGRVDLCCRSLYGEGCLDSRPYLSKARAQQQVGGLAHELPLLNSPIALAPPAVKGTVHVSLGEIGQGFSKLLLLLDAAVQVAAPSVESMALSAVCEIGQCTLRFALLVLGQLDSVPPASPGCR